MNYSLVILIMGSCVWSRLGRGWVRRRVGGAGFQAPGGGPFLIVGVGGGQVGAGSALTARQVDHLLGPGPVRTSADDEQTIM
jgi:hypothetical protein